MSAVRPVPSGMLLRLGLATGLVTGLVEVGLLALSYYGLGKFLILSRDAVWMAPVVDALLFTLLAGILALARRLLPRVFTARLAVTLLIIAMVLAWLLHFPRLHLAAACILALGVGFQAGRLLAPRLVAWHDRIGILATGLGVVVGALTVGTLLHHRLEERQALAKLRLSRAGAPNVLLIILDTVRGMNLSLYGYPRPTTPNIERWAADGVVFDRAFSSAPWTLPSHASMFTGRDAFALRTNWETPLEKTRPTLAEVLARNGYATAGFVANVRYAGRETGLARGFARYEDYRVTVGEALKSARLTEALHSTLAHGLHLPPLRQRVRAPDINARFLGWLDQRDSTRPFFAFLNYLDAHAPYLPPESYRKAFETRPGAPLPDIETQRERLTPAQARPSMDRYDAAIASLDAQIGRLLQGLERRGLLERTLVVLASDHGEAFAEHGLVGHANSLYRPTLQVPLVLVYPGHLPAGIRIAEPVTLRNLAATITELALGRAELPGTSLSRLWHEAGSMPPDPLVASIRRLINQPAWWPASRGDMFSLMDGRLHYIVNRGDGTEELFDLETDPTEQHDLARSSGARELPRLRRLLAQATRDSSPPLAVH